MLTASRWASTHCAWDALGRLTKSGRIELPGGEVHPHDARRTFTAAAERLGVSKLVIDRVLQHSLGKVGDTYFVGDDAETRRKAHEAVDDAWAVARGEKREGRVIANITGPGRALHGGVA
jgi:integrase